MRTTVVRTRDVPTLREPEVVALARMLEVAEEPLAAGMLVAGRYRLVEVLGQGGMGVVWSATDEATQRTAALKFLRGDGVKDGKRRERFVREARASLSIVHPNVARVHDVGETEAGTPFMVMDRLSGESLRARLARGRMSPAECAWVFDGVLAAVGAAHRMSIVHRDLKPENVFLAHAPGARPDVIVLDFGIAKSLVPSEDQPSLTSTGGIVGTPHYMSPEQIFGDADIDTRADVWALGVMLYECLAGRRFTEGANVGQVLKIITHEEIVPLARAAPDVPPDLAALVGRMLAKDRRARPPLSEVAATLVRYDVRTSGAPAAPSVRNDPLSVPTRDAPLRAIGPGAIRPGATGPGATGPGAIGPGVPISTTSAVVRPPPNLAPPPPQPMARPGAGAWIVGAFVGLVALAGLGAAGVLGVQRWRAVDGAALATSAAPLALPATSALPASPTPSAMAGVASASVTPPRSSGAAASGTTYPRTPPAITPTAPASAPSAAPSGKAPNPAYWDVSVGKMRGFDDRDTGAIYGNIRSNGPSLQACFPAPTDDVIWGSYSKFYWPAKGPTTVVVTILQNDKDATDAAAAPMKACVEKKIASWNVPAATGQKYIDGGTSYLFMSAGWYRRPRF